MYYSVTALVRFLPLKGKTVEDRRILPVFGMSPSSGRSTEIFGRLKPTRLKANEKLFWHIGFV